MRVRVRRGRMKGSEEELREEKDKTSIDSGKGVAC